MAEESLTTDERIRKLASIQEIADLQNHPDPETKTLQVASILGWQVVVSKNDDLKIGQLVVFCEIDSMLPGNTAWLPAAIKKRVENQKKKDFFRVKTIRLRGELSQGLIIPDSLSSYLDLPNDAEWKIGDDVTNVLKIEKYEAPICSNKKLRQTSKISTLKSFPTHLLSKTDEPRIQSYPRLLELIKSKPFYSSVKLDGMSATYLIDPETDEFLVCSRNYVRKCPTVPAGSFETVVDPVTCPYFYVARTAKLEEKLRMNPGIAIQGEICGPNIQNNPLGLRDLQFFIFNVIDIPGRHDGSFDETPKPLEYHAMREACNKMDLPMVPIEEKKDDFDYCNIKQLLERARGKYEPSGKTREGLVFRSWDQSVSFKVINNDFLL